RGLAHARPHRQQVRPGDLRRRAGADRAGDAGEGSARMSEQEPRWVDIALSNLLRGGVLLSIAIVTVGIVLTFVNHHEYFGSRPALGALTAPGAQFPHTL